MVLNTLFNAKRRCAMIMPMCDAPIGSVLMMNADSADVCMSSVCSAYLDCHCLMFLGTPDILF